jgi:ABC-type polysaccharide/polyol phosphate export permease
MLRSLLESRYLIAELVARDIRSRYMGSLLGLFWSVLNPLLQLGLYTLVFSVFLKIRMESAQTTAGFAELLFCALLPWTAIHECISRSAGSFLEHANLVRKARFPLQVLPFSLMLSALVHQGLASVVFAGVVVVSGSLTWIHLPWLLLLVPLQAVFMFGSALLISAVNVFFRDAMQMVAVLLMFVFWLTPIVYSRALLPPPFDLLLAANPLTHLVEAYRFAFFGAPALSAVGLLYWAAFALVMLGLGAVTLRRCRAQILDLV